MKRVLSACFFASCLLFLRCAQQSAPTGGPKDVTPPELVSTYPKNQSTDFAGERIVLEFNEYINVDNINQQLLITPALEGTYRTRIRPKGVTLTLEKPLRPNTTYSFNFRQTFKDVTERNPARNVKLVFSTGPVIDSLTIQGKITNLLTNQPVFDATVGLYPVSDTLTFAKVKPYYFTRTDSAGNYILENLRSGLYRIAAITDGNNNLLYDAQKERIGFEERPFELAASLTNRNLAIVMVDRSPNRVVTTRPTVNYYSIIYNKGIKQVWVTFDNPADSLPYLQLDEKTVRFFNTKNATDTIRATIETRDSLDLVFRHTQKIKFRPRGRKEEGTRENFDVKTQPADREEVVSPLLYKIRFNKPIRAYTLDAIRVEGDTVNRVQLTEKNVVWNAYRSEVTIETPFRGTRNVRVTIPKGTFLSVEQDSNRVIQTLHPLRNPDNFGIIRGRVLNATTPFVIELLDAEYKVVQTLRDQANYEFTFVKPGTYFVRVVADRNGNGRWDPGDPSRFELPERIIFYPSKILVKANWEVESNDVSLN
jgi:uncharacterized protein (DUF2141 family)